MATRIMKYMIRTWAITLFTLLVLIPSMYATTLLKKNLDDLVFEADTVVLGTIVGKASDWDINYMQHRSLIYTTYTVDVEQTIKGTEEETVEFRSVGGEVESCSLVVPSAPHFEVGERVILFLRPSIPDAVCDVVGFEQGRFTVTGDTVEENGMKLHDFLSLISSRLYR